VRKLRRQNSLTVNDFGIMAQMPFGTAGCAE
jgi:hypothetical protein